MPCAVLVLAGCSPSSEPERLFEPAVALDGSYVVAYDGTGTVNGAPADGLFRGKNGWVFRTTCDTQHCVAAGGAIVDPDNPGAPLNKPWFVDYVDGHWIMVDRAEDALTCAGPNGEEFRSDGWSIWDIAVAPDMTLRPTITTVGSGSCPSVSVVTPTIERAGDPVGDFPIPDAPAQPAAQAPAAAFHGEYTATTTRRGARAEPETARRTVTTSCLRTGDRCVTTATTPGEPGGPFGYLAVYDVSGDTFVRGSVPLPSRCGDGAMGVATESEKLVLAPDATSNPLQALAGGMVRTFTTGCPGTAEFDIAYALGAA